MTVKTRLIVLVMLVVIFFVIAPSLVLYSLGYRIDFENGKVTTTGGIYVRVQPPPAIITVDNRASETTGLFSNSVFVQNLLPGQHAVLIEKDGYYTYQKNLPVIEKEVTKLENVILFSKNIPFEIIQDKSQFSLLKQKPLERFVIKSNNLYYSDAPENLQLTISQKNTPILRGLVAFKVSNDNITWLGTDGFLKRSDQSGQNTENLSQVTLKIDFKKSYRLEILSQNIFLKEGNSLLLLNQETNLFGNFYNPVKDFKVSPDGQNIIYYNDNEIMISQLSDNLKEKVSLAKTAEKIIDLYWLNNDYIIFNHGNKITISEIDYRGNINAISLPEIILLSNSKNVNVVKPEILFDQQNKRLYILTGNQLIFSDKILP